MNEMNKDIAIIFDFNGTCIFDGVLHDKAWQIYIEELALKEVNDEEVDKYIKGKTAKETLEHFLGYELTDNMIVQFSEEKERIYRNILVKENVELAPGLEGFLNYLLLARVKRTIATTANLENMNLYFERFGLDRWFKWEDVVIGAGNIPLKPHPDLFLAAIEKLGMSAEQILVFEDSEIGIKAALAAGIKHIIVVVGDKDSKGEHFLSREYLDRPEIIAKVEDFTELGSISDLI